MSEMNIHAHSPQKTADSAFFFDVESAKGDIHVLEDRLKVTDGGVSMKDYHFPFKLHFFFKNPDKREGATTVAAALGASGYGGFACVRTDEFAFKAGILEIEINSFSDLADKADEVVDFVVDLFSDVLLTREVPGETLISEEEPERKLYTPATPIYITVPETKHPDDRK